MLEHSDTSEWCMGTIQFTKHLVIYNTHKQTHCLYWRQHDYDNTPLQGLRFKIFNIKIYIPKLLKQQIFFNIFKIFLVFAKRAFFFLNTNHRQTTVKPPPTNGLRPSYVLM